jgi:hypothetical protein
MMGVMMRDLLGLILLILALLGMVLSGTSEAASPNIIVLGDQSGPNSVPLDGPVYRKALESLSDQLHAARFKVYDKTLLTAAVAGQSELPGVEAEIIDLMRGLKRPPIDIVVVFAVQATAEKFAYTTNLQTRATAKLLDVHTRQHLGRFETASPASFRVPAACTRTCLAEVLGEDAVRVSRELGAEVADTLREMTGLQTPPQAPPPSIGGGLLTGYTILFVGFEPAEISEIEEYLVVFSGYHHHRPVSAKFRHYEFWYESAITSGRLNRNLNKMLEYLEISGNVSLASNVFTVERAEARLQQPASWDDW